MKKFLLFFSLIAILLIASSCAVIFPWEYYPTSYYVEGICPGPGFIWIAGPYHGHNGHWIYRGINREGRYRYGGHR
jgi:hypothetical protein